MRRWCPSDKRSHATYADAIVALVEATTDPDRAGRAHECRVYRCPQCDFWHLSKKPRLAKPGRGRTA